MILYVRPYQGKIWRFAYSFLVQMPVMIWLRWVSLIIPNSKTFINFTGLPDSVLVSSWVSAQQSLATQSFPTTDSGTPMHAPDTRALTVQPSNVTVVSCPDEPIANMVKVDPAWSKDKDPSGAILVLNGFEYEPVHGITCVWKRPRIYGAASQIPQVLVYEMQNVILSKLGYDVSGR